MKSVMFTFDERASEENQNRIRNQILELPGVHNVGRISPNATKPALRRFWYAEVADETAASALLKRLREHDDVQSADLPAERGLI
ncbi:MAG: hypothetical protein QOD89_2747 [Bradyrhizobium sp.]|jgi:hypothetical protein|nr:hypothetical protein [Bradyrhizobium sp.]